MQAFKRVFFLAAVFCATFFATSVEASQLSYISDTISTSAPGTTTVSHTVRFTATNAIPASGKIVIVPESGAFTLPGAFDYTDVDLAISSGGPYIDRTLAATANATDDSVSITGNTLTVTLNSSNGINAGEDVLIELGTIATTGAIGDQTLTNPSGVQSYRIRIQTRTGGDIQIDSGTAMMVIVSPVSVSGVPIDLSPSRSNGLPSGTIAANHQVIEISLNTDKAATCRYSTSTNVEYESMTNTFSSNASSTIFYATETGHQNGTTYTYYVRCEDTAGNENTTDYTISFSLEETPEFEGSITAADGGPGGVGSFPGGSSKLYLSTITLSGLASPLSTVTILKDGVSVMTKQTNADGTFTATPAAFERGVYTFMMYVRDRTGLRSSSYSTTLSFAQGTNNTISDVIIPPTIAADSENVGISEPIKIYGQGAPGATIELLIDGIKTFSASTTKSVAGSPDGMWEVNFNSKLLTKGSHIVRARAIVPGRTQSGLSAVLLLAVGDTPLPAVGGETDMNSDGKVNLTDFSIMLSFWGTKGPQGDINADGAVNIADFSILLFNWTG